MGIFFKFSGKSFIKSFTPPLLVAIRCFFIKVLMNRMTTFYQRGWFFLTDTPDIDIHWVDTGQCMVTDWLSIGLILLWTIKVAEWQLFGESWQLFVKQAKTLIKNKTEVSETEYVWSLEVFLTQASKRNLF